ncbi:putative efflux protein, MATE family [Halogranum amylolyticum]|uniref:Multidrug-efflux transporter n=1 Tax=Halogranum amylolyticum TaxID=660520 RepID=A0A1H8PP83_9EURY|nr:MATE family efflux transporter [Halogranum amylolyticum]SEO43581.1 putative efflux protein, MATE family [Halogranum amylolyticum]
MLNLAWPMVAIQLLQVAYNLADTFWLGALSADAVGALSLAFPLIFLLISVGGGFTTAGTILVAQHMGADSERAAGHIAGQTLSFVTVVAVGIAVAGFLLTDSMLGLLPADAATARQIVPLAADYMRLFFLGMPALFGFFIFTSLMRGYGNTRTPLVVMLVSVVVNVVLDPFLIFGWGPFPAMAIEGAAVATVFSRVVATLIGVYVLFGTDAGPTIAAADLVPRLDDVRDIVRLGVPSALEQSTSSMAMILLTGMVATFPPAVVAAYGLGNRLISLAFLPAMGMSQAIDTVVGQNLGAGRPDRAQRASYLAMKLVAGVMVGVAVVAWLFPEPIVGVFISTDTAQAAATIAHASDYLRTVAVMFAFMGVLQVALGTFRGAGNTRTALAFSLVTLWVGRLPATYYLVFVEGWGPTGVWVAVAVGDVVGCLAAVAWLSRGTWKESIVDDDTAADREADDGGCAHPPADD